MHHSLTINGHTIELDITHCVNVKPDAMCCDSADDCLGYREVDFEILSAPDDVDEDDIRRALLCLMGG